jgi:hypothetical protein
MHAGHGGLGSGVTRRVYGFIGVMAGVLAVGFGPTVASASAEAIEVLPGCTTNDQMTASLVGGARNDDGSSTEEAALGFTVNFEGHEYTKVWVNNNGNVTFGSALSTYTPAEIGSVGLPIIAPFWADVDTRGEASAVTTWGDTEYQGHKAFCVLWNGVGYYSEKTNKLNKFQLLLVERPDLGTGDFDIIFKYGQIQWEAGEASGGNSEGLGGAAPRVGFGLAGGGTEEIAGSGTNGAFLTGGPAALEGDEENSTTPGNLMFPVIGGEPQGEAGLHGLVSSHNAALVDAAVQACTEPSGPCSTTTTTGQGRYSFPNLASGNYNVTVNPPTADAIDLPTTVGPVTVTAGVPIDKDIVMSTLTPPPSGFVVGGIGTFDKGSPILEWKESTPISVVGCAGATSATYEVIVPANSPSGMPRTIQGPGPLAEGPSGTYKGTVTPLAPFNGFAQIRVVMNCPAPSAPVIGSFDIYVDPSGHVVNTSGEPVAGATVTLMSAATSAGPFTAVPNENSIMSPANRTNPGTTDTAGRFGWDVLAGFYTVTAAKAGCINPTTPTTPSVSTPVLTVPPPITELKLTLNCDPLTNLTAVAQRNGSIKVTFQSTGAGTVKGTGTTSQKVRVTVVKKGKHGKKTKKKVLKVKVLGYASGHSSVSGAKIVTFTVTPSRAGLALLKQHKSLVVPVKVLFAPSPSGTAVTKTVQVTVKYVKPKKKKKKK